MVKCPRCGYENSASSTYCDNCAYLLTDQNGNRLNSRKSKGWGSGVAKKIIIVMFIIVIALLLFSFIYNTTQPDNETSLNVITDDGNNHHVSSYPYTAVVEYDGYWYGKMGDPNYLVEQSGSGRGKMLLDCAAWERVHIEAQKQDSNDGPLTIKLYKNDQVVAENSTTAVGGSVSINYNY